MARMVSTEVWETVNSAIDDKTFLNSAIDKQLNFLYSITMTTIIEKDNNDHNIFFDDNNDEGDCSTHLWRGQDGTWPVP